MARFITFILLQFIFMSAWSDLSQDRLERYSNLAGAPGHEHAVRAQFTHDLDKLHVPYSIDKQGNVFVKGKADKGKPKLLIMAHMDEVGLMVKSIDDDGFIRVMPLGGFVLDPLWAQPWIITTSKGPISAVSGIDAPHVILNKENKHRELSLNDLFLDTGYSKSELAKLGVHPGLAVTPDTRFRAHGQHYAGKAFDDRAGMALLVELIESIKKDPALLKSYQVEFAATVQEEIGLRGARTVSASLAPDVVLNLEAGIAHDYPMQFDQVGKPELGHGPSLFVYERSMIPDAELLEQLAAIAEKKHIPFQWESEVSYGQDGSVLQGSGTGAKVINIGIPVRYAHTHIGMMDRRDYDNAKRLILAYLTE